jgi:dUTP pyrophosphatase
MNKKNNNIKTIPKNPSYTRTYKSVYSNNEDTANGSFAKKKPYSYKIIKVFVEKHGDYQIPGQGSYGAAGYDLFASKDVVLPSQKAALVPTGLHVAFPKGYEMQIRSRSGLCLNESVIVMNSPGTVDSDYRGEIKVLLFNLGDKDFFIKKGDRIAQAVFAAVAFAKFIEVDQLNPTQRGEQGFGSSGLNGPSNYKNVSDSYLHGDQQNHYDEEECCEDDQDPNEPLSECGL